MKAGDKAIAAYANQEALDFYERAQTVCDTLGARGLMTAADVARKRGFVKITIGDLPEAIADFDRMLEAARNQGNRHLEGLALADRGAAEWLAHQLEKSEQTLRAVWTIADEGFDDLRFCANFWLFALFTFGLSRCAEARPFLHVADTLEEEVEDPFHRGWWMMLRPCVPIWEGRFDDALSFLERRRGIIQAIPNISIRVNVQWRYALAWIGKGAYQQALDIIQEILATCDRTGEVVTWPRVLNTMGWLCSELQNHERAMAWNAEGVEVAKEINAPDPEIECNALVNLGDNLLALGRLDEAEGYFQQVERIVRSPQSHDYFMLWRYAQHLFHSFGEWWFARSDYEKAHAYADECLNLAEETNSRKNIVKARRLRGQVFLAQGRLRESDRELAIALAVAQAVGNPPQLWKTYVATGDLQQTQGKADDAKQAYRDAAGVIEAVATGLDDESLKNAFLNSSEVRTIQQKASTASL